MRLLLGSVMAALRRQAAGVSGVNCFVRVMVFEPLIVGCTRPAFHPTSSNTIEPRSADWLAPSTSGELVVLDVHVLPVYGDPRVAIGYGCINSQCVTVIIVRVVGRRGCDEIGVFRPADLPALRVTLVK